MYRQELMWHVRLYTDSALSMLFVQDVARYKSTDVRLIGVRVNCKRTALTFIGMEGASKPGKHTCIHTYAVACWLCE